MSTLNSAASPDGPISFVPLYYERVWGGRRLESDLGRSLPPGAVIGESWELVDRPEAQSVVKDGVLAGKTLHELWTQHRAQIFGAGAPDTPRFPLLGKILDARETLSVQVHPPAHAAAALKGEPKTEMWHLLDADSNAALYAGFTRGVTRADFEKALPGGLEPLLHRVPVTAGDTMFVPSGRCHAIGAGCLIIEIQQNSDTTYRVFDWNRTGLDGKPRELHVEQSLASIDFADHEPPAVPRDGRELLVQCDHFETSLWNLNSPRAEKPGIGVIYVVAQGKVGVGGGEFDRGDWFILPACATQRTLVPVGESASVLRCVIP